VEVGRSPFSTSMPSLMDRNQLEVIAGHLLAAKRLKADVARLAQQQAVIEQAWQNTEFEVRKLWAAAGGGVDTYLIEIDGQRYAVTSDSITPLRAVST